MHGVEKQTKKPKINLVEKEIIRREEDKEI